MIMTAQKKLMLLLTLSLICVFSSFYYEEGVSLVFGQREERLLSDVVGLPSQQEALKTQEIIIKTVTDYKAENLRDPFQDYFIKEPENSDQPEIPGSTTEIIKPPKLQIQGIFWGANFPQAIVNKMIVKEGDTIEGVKILRIQKEGLTLFFANTEYSQAAPAYTGVDNLRQQKEGGKE